MKKYAKIKVIAIIVITILFSCSTQTSNENRYQSAIEKKISASIKKEGCRVLYSIVEDTISSSRKEYLEDIIRQKLQSAGFQSDGSMSVKLNDIEKTKIALQIIDSLRLEIENIEQTEKGAMIKYIGTSKIRINKCADMVGYDCIDSIDKDLYFESYFDSVDNNCDVLIYQNIQQKPINFEMKKTSGESILEDVK